MFGRRKPSMVDADAALPGRSEPLNVSDRHVVLGTSLTGPHPGGTETIVFGMGCFWGAERIFWQIPGVHVTAAGYAGGYTANPIYEEICTGRTGHAEVALVVYEPAKVELERLLKEFWENHDPTTPNRQGNDVGTQYRSAIYTTTDAQLAAALDSANRYQRALTEAGYGTISTEIRPLGEAGDGTFYFAEDYHQGYLHKHPRGYCNHGFCQVSYDTAGHGQGVAAAELPEF